METKINYCLLKGAAQAPELEHARVFGVQGKTQDGSEEKIISDLSADPDKVTRFVDLLQRTQPPLSVLEELAEDFVVSEYSY